ncbi:MAG: ABC transporter ATP-binding protein [Candidatus Atribacteria bacterium]|nr:ABC transporter ATP-binding protein [Candidatus Atribacteria bacterium]
MIELHNVSYEFSKGWPRKQRQIILSNISVKFDKGKTFGLMGYSGTGKTTLGKMVVGLLKPISGTVFFHGKDISRMIPPDSLFFRRKVQMLFQDPQGSLNPKKRVFSSLRDVLNMTKVPFNQQKDVIEKVLETVGLSTDFLLRYPAQLSGGQNQRISLARILLLKPEFIVLDEPTSALDISVQAQILSLLRNLQKNHGLGYLFISHDPEVIQYMSHSIGILKDGNLDIVHEE